MTDLPEELPKSLTEFLGTTGRTMSVGKHHASNWHYLKALIERLDATGSVQDKEVADAIVWLCWWRDFDRVQADRLRGEIETLEAKAKQP